MDSLTAAKVGLSRSTWPPVAALETSGQGQRKRAVAAEAVRKVGSQTRCSTNTGAWTLGLPKLAWENRKICPPVAALETTSGMVQKQHRP